MSRFPRTLHRSRPVRMPVLRFELHLLLWPLPLAPALGQRVEIAVVLQIVRPLHGSQQLRIRSNELQPMQAGITTFIICIKRQHIMFPPPARRVFPLLTIPATASIVGIQCSGLVLTRQPGLPTMDCSQRAGLAIWVRTTALQATVLCQCFVVLLKQLLLHMRATSSSAVWVGFRPCGSCFP